MNAKSARRAAPWCFARDAVRFTAASVLAYSLSACQTAAPAAADDLVTANQYAAEGLLREAIVAYTEVLEKNPKNMAAHRNLGIVLLKAGRYRDAAQHFNDSMPEFANDFATNFYYGEALRARGQFRDAIYRYSKAQEAKPDDAKVLRALAWSYYRVSYWKAALQTSRKLYQLFPTDIQSALIHGRILLKLGKIDETRQIIAGLQPGVRPTDAPHLRVLEGDLSFAEGKLDAAAASYTAALAIQPLSGNGLFGLGLTHFAKGQKDKATRYFQRALNLNAQEFAAANYYLAQILRDSAPQEARKHLQTFLRDAELDAALVDKVSDARKLLAGLDAGGAKAAILPQATSPKSASSRPSGN